MAAKTTKSKGRGRPSGSINSETKTWLKRNNISEELYKKILNKIRGN